MTADQYTRLEPFLRRLGDKSIIIVYLLTVLKPSEIREINCEWLSSHRSGIPFLDSTIDNFLLQFDDARTRCFTFSGGRPYSLKDIEKILVRSYSSCDADYVSIPSFKSHIGAGL